MSNDREPAPEEGVEPSGTMYPYDVDGAPPGAAIDDEPSGRAGAADGPLETFLRSPETYVHESWFEHVEHGALLARLNATARGRPHVGVELMERHELAPATFPELDDPLVRTVCLADPDHLSDLVWCLGLACGSPRLRREMDGEVVRRVRRSIGDGAYRFAIARTEHVVLDERELARLPELDIDALPWAVNVHGLRALACFCRSLPDGLVRRVALKLPARAAPHLDAPFEHVSEERARGWVERSLVELETGS